ncbi:MAG: glycosyltransferase [Bacteroidetes bacterium]|nr:glycosyltransferase [Bacteroidota bacterium]
MVESTLYFLIFLVFYAYLGYGIAVKILIGIKGKYPQTEADEMFRPTISLIVPCFNEEAYILDKVKNSQALEYPPECLQIIFISDGSNDRTAELLKDQPGILHLHSEIRAGKAAAMNRAIPYATGEILVFCDANTDINPNALMLLSRHYADERVGGVTGEKRILSKEKAGASEGGEGIYWKYESMLKKADSDLYTVVGAAGELMSYRKSLYEELEPDTLLDDFMQSMRIVLKGYRIVYEPKAIATETASANVEEELKRKIRICAGGWQSMSRLKPAFNVFKRPLIAFEFISHRVLRWSLAAFALPFIFMLNIFLLNQAFFQLLFLGQCAFYASALLGWYFEKKGSRIKLLYVPSYFFIMNLAVFLGFRRFLKGSQSALWERAKRA